MAFPSGTRLRIDGSVDPTALRIVSGGVDQVITVVPTDRIYLCRGATEMR